MNHMMGLYPENFEKVKLGQKRREYRLYDEKRQKIKCGDTITFYNTQTEEKVTVTVEDIFVYKDFKSCYQDFWREDFAHRNVTLNQLVEETYSSYWSKDKEEKYGCVVFQIKLI